jgi:hypothetical protein
MDEQLAERLAGIGLQDHSDTAEYRIFGPRARARQQASPVRSITPWIASETTVYW